jgi:hypothetical protein
MNLRETQPFETSNTTKLHRLYRHQFEVARVVSQSELEALPPGAHLSTMRRYTDDLVLRLRAHLWRQPEQRVFEENFPMTWWDAVKERFCPRWLRQRGWVRVNFTKVRVDARVVYRDLKIMLPDERHYVELVVDELGWQ